MTIFPSTPSDIQTTLQLAYVAASGTMTLAQGYGARLAAQLTAEGFAAVSANAPLWFTVFAPTAINAYGQPLDFTKLAVFQATGLAGDVLSGVSVLGAWTDQGFPAGSVLLCATTGMQLRLIQQAIQALQNAGVSLAIGAAITGATAGDVLRVDATGKLAQGGIFVDPTTGRVGIVTTTPNASDPYARLAIVDSDSLVVSQFLKNSGSGQVHYYVANSTGVQWGVGLYGGDPYLHFSTAGGAWATIRHDTGALGINVTTPLGQCHSSPTSDALSAFIAQAHSGTQSAPLYVVQAISSTAAARDVGYIDGGFSVSTDAVYTGYIDVDAHDHAGRRKGMRVASDGTQPLLGFYGVTPVARAAAPVTLSDVITALRNLGLCN